MLNFTPPPRQQVLYGIRIQAEQARNLVEDLQAGSETALKDLLSLVSQILARARLYKWPRLTIWASALEERLTKATSAEKITDEDVEWFAKHVERLDGVLESPSGAEDGAAGTMEIRMKAGGAREAPTPAPVFDESEESVDLDYNLDMDETPVPGGVEVSLEGLEDDEPVEAPPEKRYTPTRPPATPAFQEMAPDDADALDAAFEALTSEHEAASDEDSAEESSSVDALASDGDEPWGEDWSSVDSVLKGIAGDQVQEINEEGDEELGAGSAEEAAAAPVDEAAAAPVDEARDEAPSDLRDSAPEVEPRREAAAAAAEEDIDVDGRATLGRLEIQRREERWTNTEIQGPDQYIVVSVSLTQDVHLWLGRMLPERRFELLGARGAAEAEMLCREHQPDLLLVAWDAKSDLLQQTLMRIRENPLTRYVRVALVPEEDSLACHLAATRVDAIGVIPRSAEQKDVFSRVLLCVLASGELPSEEMGETSMSELSDLLLGELRVELDSISDVVGDVVVPIGGLLGDVLRDTSRKLRDGVKLALGCDSVSFTEDLQSASVEGMEQLFRGKRALVMEADRLRRAELARVLGELRLEVLPPMPDLTKALEAGLAWAPDVFVGGAPTRDTKSCLKILRRDIALSSMSGVIVQWPDSDRQWPDAKADMVALQPLLMQQLAEAFAPQAEIQRQLREHREVTGRVESCGVLGLIQLVMANRDRALLEVMEGTETIRAMIADGKILDAFWSETDGKMTSHFEAFARLLAVARGRFYVHPLAGDPPSLALPGSLTELLTAACHWWRPMGLVIDQRLLDIEPLALDKRRASELKRQTGKIFRKVVSALSKGATPADLVDAGISPNVVAHVLRELVKRSVVKELPVS